MHIKKGDKVKVIAGKEKGKISEVISVDKKNNRVTLKDLNVQTHHVKPRQMGQEGGLQKKEGSIHASNVLLYSEKLQKGVRTSKVIENGKKVRICKKTEERFN